MMKKILITFLLLLFIIAGFLFYFINKDGVLGKGSYFIYYASPDIIKSTLNENIHIGDILKVKYNDDFIIACRVPAKFYNCPNSNPIQYENYLEYLIIDKNNNKIYSTKSYKKFLNKVYNDSVKLTFNKEEIALMKKKIIKYKHIYNKNNNRLTQCKKMYTIRMINF